MSEVTSKSISIVHNDLLNIIKFLSSNKTKIAFHFSIYIGTGNRQLLTATHHGKSNGKAVDCDLINKFLLCLLLPLHPTSYISEIDSVKTHNHIMLPRLISVLFVAINDNTLWNFLSYGKNKKTASTLISTTPYHLLSVKPILVCNSAQTSENIELNNV